MSPSTADRVRAPRATALRPSHPTFAQIDAAFDTPPPVSGLPAIETPRTPWPVAPLVGSIALLLAVLLVVIAIA